MKSTFVILMLILTEKSLALCLAPGLPQHPDYDQMDQINSFVENQNKPACTSRDILRAHAHLFPKDQRAIFIKEGGGIINPFYVKPRTKEEEEMSTGDFKAKLLEGSSPTTEQEVLTLAEEIRELMIREITAGRPITELSAQQKTMVSRIKLLLFKFKNCSNVEASNHSLKTQIVFCKNILKTPRLAMAQLIAHEIGHSLDPCMLEATLYRKVDSTLPLNKELNLSDPYVLNQMSEPDVEFVSDMVLRREESKDDLSAFQTLLNKNTLSIVNVGIERTQNPVFNAIQCLAQRYPHREALPLVGDGICGMQEAGAQFWSSRVTAAYIKESPPRSKMEALAIFANSYVSFADEQRSEKEVDMDEIYLNEPGIQEMLGCEPIKNKSCASEFRTLSSQP